MGTEAKQKLTRLDWVMAGLRALVQGGIGAVRVEPLAREIGATKGSFYWHFRNLADLHQAMLDLWEEAGTTSITAAVRASGLEGRDQLFRLVDLVSIQPDDAVGGIAVEPAMRDWGRIDPSAKAVLERVDRQRLGDLCTFLAASGMRKTELIPAARIIYAAVIGLEELRVTIGLDMRESLRALVERLLADPGEGQG